MQIGGFTPTAHSWTLVGIVFAVASGIAGIAAFVANVLKSIQTVDELKRKKSNPASEESRKVDLTQVGITPFKMAGRPMRDAIAKGAATGAAIGIVETAVHNGLNSHRTDTHAPHAVDVPPDHGAALDPDHPSIAGHVDGLSDWIEDIFS
jgi:hypothetical protein